MKLKGLSFLLIFLIFFISGPVRAKQGYNPEWAEKFAKIAHEAFKDKDFLKAGEFYEKAYNAGNIKVYLENSITAYLHYSFDCLNEKNYDPAIKYCEKVISMQPNNNDAKEILADIYYSRGSDFYYRGKEYRAKKDLGKSLKYSVLSVQKQKAEELLKKISPEKVGFSCSKPVIKMTSDNNPANRSIYETIELMELKIYGETFEGLSIYQRTCRLEKDVFNRNYQREGVLVRIERLKRKVLPELIGKK